MSQVSHSSPTHTFIRCMMPALSPWAAALCKPSGWWPPYVWRVKEDILQAHYHIIAIITVQWENRRRLSITIGACRAVWVPGQDLATLHLMHNCGKRILSLHCTLYVRLCTHMLYAADRVSSHPILVIWVWNNLGLQAPMSITKYETRLYFCFFTFRWWQLNHSVDTLIVRVCVFFSLIT